MTDATQPEIVTDMPYAEYAARDGINATAIKAGVVSPLHMRHTMTGHDKPVTPAMRWGKLVHSAVLEPDLFFESMMVFDGRKYGKAWNEFCETNDPQYAVSSDEQKRLYAMGNAVHANRHAHSLIDGTAHEVSAFWHDPLYGNAKARLDGMKDTRGIVEYKTTGSTDKRHWTRTAFNMNYHLQLGWQWAGVNGTAGVDMPVHVICQEQTEPYDVVVYRVPDTVIEIGLEQAAEIAKRYRACEAVGSFPGVSDEIEIYELPAWAMGGGGEWSPNETGKEE